MTLLPTQISHQEIIQRAENYILSATKAYTGRDWRAQRIVECEDPLIQVPPDRCMPYYHDVMGLAMASRDQYLRSRLLNAFIEANHYLPDDDPEDRYEIRLLDGWRSLRLQWELYWFYMKEYTLRGTAYEDRFHGHSPKMVCDNFLRLPEKVRDELHAANQVYVSLPNNDPARPSPHVTGGAADVWLFRNDDPVDLGVEFDDMTPRAAADHHMTERSTLTPDIVFNRCLLINAMGSAGFTIYPPEIWHFNMGNQMHSLVTCVDAQYSYIEPIRV